MESRVHGCLPVEPNALGDRGASSSSSDKRRTGNASNAVSGDSNRAADRLIPDDDLLRLVAQSSVDLEYWTDAGGRLIYVSPQCEVVSGYQIEELIASPSLLFDMIHPEDRDLVLGHSESEAPHGDWKDREPLEFRLIHRDGSVRWMSHRCRQVYGKDGELLGTRVTNRDVTRLKEQQRSMEESEKLYRAIVEEQSDPICRFTPDGTLKFVNTAFRECFDGSGQELTGTSFLHIMAEGQAHIVHEKLDRLSPDIPQFVYEQETPVAMEEPRWFQWTFRGRFDRQGQLVEVLAVARDITVCKMTEYAFRDSEERYRELVNAIPDGVVTYDTQGNAVFLNDAFRMLYGWSKEDLSDNSTGFVPPEELEATNAAWEQTYTGENVLLETRRKAKYGKLIDVQLQTAILRDHDGNITESLVIHRDITGRKKSEMALRKAHEDLGRRVEERTRELAETNYRLRKEIEVRREAEEKLGESEYRNRMLVENAPIGIMWCNKRGRIFQANSNLLTILGLVSLDEEGPVNVFFHPSMVQAGISDEIRKCIDSDAERTYECPYLNDWGKSLWLRVHMVPTKDTEGRINGVQAILEDVTSRRQAEIALSESEERFRAVVETAKDCIFIKDRDLVYTHVNPAFLKALDLGKTKVLGKTNKDLFGEQEARYVMDLENRVLTDGRDVETTHSLTTHGVRKTFECVWVPLRTAHEEIIGICGIARDVTERKAMEQRARRTVGLHRSAVMEATLQQLLLAAESDSIVLLLGESGSGKDFLSKYLHDHSPRAGGPYFAINCAALAASVAESELFGHEAGSFTGSRGRKRGLLEMAEGGTLLLNEIGELSQELQAKLLTFLDTQSFTRVGGEKTIRVNIRIVAATNRDLKKEVAGGRFRQDLYYRLNVLAIRVPSLRERREDIPFIAKDILKELSVKLGRPAPPILEYTALDRLERHRWHGNVRELKNILERALILCRSDVIRGEDLSISEGDWALAPSDKEIPVAVSVSAQRNMNEALEAAKRRMIDGALQRTSGNVTKAARLLGVSRDALRYHLKNLGIDR